MTNYQFAALNDHEKAEAIWAGTFIAAREEDALNIALYQIDGFYVEVYYHRQLNVITRFRSFKTTELLEPYISQIDLLQLLNQ